MSDSSPVTDAVREAAALFEAVRSDRSIHAAIEEVAQVTIDCLHAGGQLLIGGNGGSAAEATPFAGELVGAFYKRDRDPLRAIPLGFDPASLTSLANDFGYEQALAKQLQALARPGDVLWALSTSGNSPNILAAMKQAKKIGVTNVLFTSCTGGAAKDLADHVLHTPEASTPRVQELHLLYGHCLCELIEGGWRGEF